MRIACICNANNFFLPLVRYLRDLGYDAELIILQNDLVNTGDPEWDSYDKEYLTFSKFVNWGFYPQGFYQTPSSVIKKDLDKYDFLIAQGQAAAFINKAGRIIDIFMPNGGDLIYIPFQPKDKKYSLNYKIKYWYFSQNHIKGMRNAKYVFLDKMNEDFELLFKKFKMKGKRVNTSCPFIYTKIYNSEVIKKYYISFPFYSEINILKQQEYQLILNHSRHVWSDFPDKFSIKGNDKLIEGFAIFLQKNPGAKFKLIMLEYGWHYQRSKELVKKLKINNHVIWLPKLKRKEIMILIDMCDLTTGQFGESWLSSGAIYECLSMGKPLIHYREDNLYNNYEELYPIMTAREPIEIASQIQNFYDSPSFYKDQGNVAKEWFIKYGIQNSLTQYLNVIRKKQKTN